MTKLDWMGESTEFDASTFIDSRLTCAWLNNQRGDFNFCRLSMSLFEVTKASSVSQFWRSCELVMALICNNIGTRYTAKDAVVDSMEG